MSRYEIVSCVSMMGVYDDNPRDRWYMTPATGFNYSQWYHGAPIHRGQVTPQTGAADKSARVDLPPSKPNL